MANRWSRWAALGLLIAGAMVVGSFGSGAALAATTYSVSFSEVGLPSGTSWSITFNSVTQSSTTAKIVFTGVSAATNIFWDTASTIAAGSTTRYVASFTYGYITVPNQLAQVVPYTTQYYVTMSTLPGGDGTVNPGSNWYGAASPFALTAFSYTGHPFQKWTSTPSHNFTFSNTTSGATVITVNGAGTVNANFLSTKYPATFTEVGLPTGTSWSVTFSGVAYPGTGASIKTGTHTDGCYSWSVAAVASAHLSQYSPYPSSGCMSMPYQLNQTIVFTKQWQITMATNPSSSGGITPTGTFFLSNGTVYPVTAYNTSGYLFSGWSATNVNITFGNKASASTNVTIHGGGTITAKFVSGTGCSTPTCNVAFREVGLPSGTSWGVTFGSLNYVSSTNTIKVAGVASNAYWSAFSPITAGSYGTQYVPIGTGSAYLYLSQQTVVMIVYVPEVYVTFVAPYGYGGGWSPGSGWYYPNVAYSVFAATTDGWAFTSWGSNTSLLTFAKATSSSTTFTAKGAATISVNFHQLLRTVTFHVENLPLGTTWGVGFDSVNYLSSGSELNITGVPEGGHGWGPLSSIAGASGVEYMPQGYDGYLDTRYSGSIDVVYQTWYLVSVVAGGTAGGAVSPSTAAYYPAGSVVAIDAINGSSVSFTGWSSSTGSITIGSTSAAATTITVNGPGTVTGRFA